MRYDKAALLVWLTCPLTLISAACVAEVNTLSSSEIMHIRTLASSCAACHGTNGNSIGITPVLAGLDAGYFSARMVDFRNGEQSSTVMHRHAKGLNVEEVYQLGLYFSQQKRVSIPHLKPQALKTEHE